MKNIVFEFEKKRDFGAVVGDSLYFFTRNFKSFLLGFLMYIGPFFLLGSLGMIYAGMKLPDLMDTGVPELESFIGLLVFIPFILVASLVMVAFVCAMVQKHQRNTGEPLIEGIWPDVRRNLWPSTVAFITMFLLIVIPLLLLGFLAFALGAEIGIALVILLLIPIVLYLTVIFSIFMIVHVLEKNPVLDSLSRAMYLVRDKWWNTFGVYIVISILASIASYIFMIPAYIIFLVQTLGSIGSGELSPQFGMWMGIMYACGFLGSLFAGMYQMVGMILQYYSLREQKDGTGLLKRIQEIDKPADETYV